MSQKEVSFGKPRKPNTYMALGQFIWRYFIR